MDAGGRGLLLLVAIVVALSLAACGGARQEATATAQPKSPAAMLGLADSQRPNETIEGCLIEVGVQFAVAPQNIAFLYRERRKGDVLVQGVGFEEETRVVVKVLTAKHGGSARWTIWYAQPFPGSLSPRQVIEQSPPRSYVAFKVRPTPSFRHEVTECTAFPPAKR
jgi:hypothetical protein